VYSISTREEGQPGFNIAGNAVSGVDFTLDTLTAEAYLKGSIKWDGCSDVNFGYHHWCGPEFWAKHVLLLQYIFTKAFLRMRRDAEDDNNHWELDIKKSSSLTNEGFGSYQTPVIGIELVGSDSTLLRDSYNKAENP
jgi:hypothetical protein